MTFGRWILVNSFSISILIMLGIGYVYKDELKLNEAYRQLLVIDPEKVLVSPKADSVETAQESSKKPLENSKPIVVESTLSKKESFSSVAEPVQKIEPLINNNEISSTTLDTEVNQSNQSKPVVKNLLNDARKAYWEKDYEKSVTLYQSQIKTQPNVADIYGELGNVFFTMGSNETAAKHYFEAGQLFLQQKQDQRAKQVYEILSKLAPKLAQQLLDNKNQIQATQ